MSVHFGARYGDSFQSIIRNGSPLASGRSLTPILGVEAVRCAVLRWADGAQRDFAGFGYHEDQDGKVTTCRPLFRFPPAIEAAAPPGLRTAGYSLGGARGTAARERRKSAFIHRLRRRPFASGNGRAYRRTRPDTAGLGQGEI